MQFVYRVRTMPFDVRYQTFICDLRQLVGTGGFQMPPKVPDNLFVCLIEFNYHAERALSDLPEGCSQIGGTGQQKCLVRLQQKQ